MSEVIKLALVGCGAICAWHRRAIVQLPQLRITAAVDSDEARAHSVARECGAAVYTSLEEALERGDFDAVDVMLPLHLHEDAAIAVLQAGRHLLLEKPMAPTLESCDRILAAARRAQRVCVVGETAQYWAEVLAARELVERGRIGQLVSARALVYFAPSPDFYPADSWRMRTASAGGGIAIDTGPHFIRALRLLCGDFAEAFAVFGHPFRPMEGESAVLALLRTREGVVACMDLLVTEAPLAPQDTFRVTGTQGEIVVNAAGVTLHAAEQPVGQSICPPRPNSYFMSFRDELADFAEAIRSRRTSTDSARMARGDVAAVLAMQRSARSGRWESISGGGHDGG